MLYVHEFMHIQRFFCVIKKATRCVGLCVEIFDFVQ